MKRILLLILPLALCCVGNSAAQKPELDTSTFDQSVRIQDDLFLHVNGTWLANTEIPSDKSNYGSFIELADL